VIQVAVLELVLTIVEGLEGQLQSLRTEVDTRDEAF
jgi:hypothetical protein